MVDAINTSAAFNKNPVDTSNKISSSNNHESSSLLLRFENKFNNEDNHDNTQKVNTVDIKKATEQINNKFDSINKSIKFFIHEASGQVAVKIINKETNEVIKEIPSAELLDLQGKIEEMVGLIIDRKI